MTDLYLDDAFEDTKHLIEKYDIDDYIDLMSWLFDVEEDIIINKIKAYKQLQ